MRTPSRFLRSLIVASLLAVAGAAAPSASARGVTPSDATAVQREEAQSHFARGHDLYAAKKYDEAAAEFDKSYAIVASPNALFFLARCDRERGKLIEAYSELGRTAAEAREHAADDPRYAKTAQAASEERDAIAQQLGFVTVTVTGGSADTTVTVAGARFPRAALGEPLPVAPGSTEIALDTPGKPRVRQTVAIASGERKSVTLDAGVAEFAAPPEPALARPPPSQLEPSGEASGRGGVRAGSYVAAGFAVAGLATFAVFGTLSNNAYSDLQAQCHGPCAAGSANQDEINRGKAEQTVANVALGVGVAGAAAAVTLFVLSLGSSGGSALTSGTSLVSSGGSLVSSGRSPTKTEKVALVFGPTWMGVAGEF